MKRTSQETWNKIADISLQKSETAEARGFPRVSKTYRSLADKLRESGLKELNDDELRLLSQIQAEYHRELDIQLFW